MSILEKAAKAHFLDGITPPNRCPMPVWEEQSPAIKNAHYKKAAAVIEAISEWKSIADAPTDGTKVVLRYNQANGKFGYTVGYRYTDTRWMTSTGDWAIIPPNAFLELDRSSS